MREARKVAVVTSTRTPDPQWPARFPRRTEPLPQAPAPLPRMGAADRIAEALRRWLEEEM
jgi:hypothetical protein